MKRWLHRLRGLFGLGTMGGFVGACIGGGWFLVEGLTGGYGFYGMSLGTMAAIWGVLGAATGVGFGLLLAATSGGRDLDDVSLWRGGALGAVAGAVGPVLVASLIVGSAPPLGIGLWFAGVGGSLGAGLGAGVLAVAKGAQRDNALGSGDASRLEAGREGARGPREGPASFS